jgi:hypothetical protein
MIATIQTFLGAMRVVYDLFRHSRQHKLDEVHDQKIIEELHRVFCGLALILLLGFFLCCRSDS